MKEQQGEVTRILEALVKGVDPAATERLFDLVYNELRTLARRKLAHEKPGHSWTPSDLVGELSARLLSKEFDHAPSRRQFFGFAASAMEKLLVDHSRKHDSKKRTPPGHRVAIEEACAWIEEKNNTTVTAIHEALEELKRLDERQYEVVRLRVWLGFSNLEVADALDVSERTVNEDWRMARAFLHSRLKEA